MNNQEQTGGNRTAALAVVSVVVIPVLLWAIFG